MQTLRQSQSLMKSFEKEVEQDLLEEELIERLLNVLRDAQCCGNDPAIMKQSQGFRLHRHYTEDRLAFFLDCLKSSVKASLKRWLGCKRTRR